MTLVEELGALEVEIVQSDVSLIIADPYSPFRCIDSDEGNIIEMGLLRPCQNLLHEHALFTSIEGVDMLPCSHK